MKEPIEKQQDVQPNVAHEVGQDNLLELPDELNISGVCKGSPKKTVRAKRQESVKPSGSQQVIGHHRALKAAEKPVQQTGLRKCEPQVGDKKDAAASRMPAAKKPLGHKDILSLLDSGGM